MKARAKAETRSTTHRKPGVRIGSHDEAKLRLLAAARGEQPLSHDEPRIWFESVDTLLRVFTPENRQLVAVLHEEQPRSVSELAERLGRDQGNVSRALSFLEECGIVALERMGREKRPRAIATALDVRVDFMSGKAALAKVSAGKSPRRRTRPKAA